MKDQGQKEQSILVISLCFSWKDMKVHQCPKVYIAQVSRGVWNCRLATVECDSLGDAM